MSAYELRDWQIIEQVEPWGPQRADYQMAMLGWIIASCLAGRKNRPRFRDFLKLFSFEPRDNSERSIEQLLAFARKPDKKKKQSPERK